MKLDDYTPILKDTGDEHVRVYLRPGTAIRLVKRLRRVRFFVNVEAFAYTTVPGDEGQGGRGYDLTDSLKVSAAQFDNVLRQKQRFETTKGEEHYVKLTRLGYCIFLG